MATGWVLGKISDALAPTVSNTVASAGGFAGGAVNAVGNSINGVGASINNSVRAYGDGAKDYGNAIMDWTKADGIRGATAANPLGLASGATGGKRSVTSPQVYHAPAPKSASKTMMTTSKTAGTPLGQKKITGAPQQKALPAPAKKAAVKSEPAKKGPTPAKSTPAVSKTPSASKPGVIGKGSSGVTKTATSVVGKPAGSVKKSTGPVKSATTSVPKPSSAGPNKYATNPLGLSF